MGLIAATMGHIEGQTALTNQLDEVTVDDRLFLSVMAAFILSQLGDDESSRCELWTLDGDAR
jgi:hypothetical protein